jgi:predicted acyl esterase
MKRAKIRFLAAAVTTALVMTAQTPAQSVELLPAPKPSKGQGSTMASYLHDVSQPMPGVTVYNSIVEHYRVAAGNGVELDTWVVRPDIDGPVPVVMDITPYYGGGSPINEGDTGHDLRDVGETLVERGYAFGISSLRGTGNSGGCFTIGGKQEAKDTAAVVEFLAEQSWSNGNVGLMGASYDGTAPQDAWVEAPPSLKTIVPISGISDLYKYNFANGVPVRPQGYAFNTYYWAIVGLGPVGLSGGAQFRDPVNVPGAVTGEVCPEQQWVQEGGISSTIDGNKDGYWEERDFVRELKESPDKERASVFYIHGLDDFNVQTRNMEEWLPAVQATGVPFKAWLGQWAHAFPKRADWHEAMTAWFDQFLKERDTGILDAPAVQVQDSDGRWRHESGYLNQRLSKMTLYPSINNWLGTSDPGGGEASYYDYNGTVSPLNIGHGPAEAVFESAPLSQDIVIAGMPRFEGTVTASGDRASLMVTLLERTPDGRETSINYAAQSLNHVSDLSYGRPTVAGRPQAVGVDFFPQDMVVHKGSRLVLKFAGNSIVSNTSNNPSFQPQSTGSTITLDLSDAKLTLPIDTSLKLEPTPN